MNRFLNLLLDFQALPRIRRARTFMEISGYPHYENVCSNILEFYFNPEEEHGMETLLLTAFFKMAKERCGVNFTEPLIPKKVNVTREHAAEDQKRLDLMIDAATFTIGIENKIYHWEANDFENYARVIDRLGSNKTVVKAVLCLRTHPGEAPPKGGFIRYTYADLWKHVRDLLGHHLPDASPKWTTYLTDFMTTTARLAGETPDEKEVTDFFMKNHDLIEQLVEDRQQLLNRIANRIRNLEGVIKSMPELAKNILSRGIYETHTLASHFNILGGRVMMDLSGSLKGWNLYLAQKDSPPVLRRIAESAPMQERYQGLMPADDFILLQQWDLHVSELELQEALVTGFTTLFAAVDEISNQSD